MRDIQDKTDGTGDILSAEAFNVNLINELQDIVSNAGFTLDPEAGPDTDTSMFSKSLVIHSTASQYYQESGVADAYVLSRSGTIEALPSYIDGMIVFFNPGNDNTGPSTINIDAIGVKDLVAADGTALTGGEVVADVYCAVRYNSSSDDFELVKSAGDDAATLGGHPASYFAVDSLAAHLAGTETFTGAKTFTENPKISRTSANANLSINVTTTSNLSQILFERSDSAVGKISYVHNATAANETLDFNVGGSLNTALRLYGDKSATFYGQVNFNADYVVLRNHARVGQDGAGDSFIDFWDDNSNVYRSFKWSDTNNAWYGEDDSGTDRKFWTDGDNASVGSGVSGSFTTADAKTVTVTDGIITSIV